MVIIANNYICHLHMTYCTIFCDKNQQISKFFGEIFLVQQLHILALLFVHIGVI